MGYDTCLQLLGLCLDRCPKKTWYIRAMERLYQCEFYIREVITEFPGTEAIKLTFAF